MNIRRGIFRAWNLTLFLDLCVVVGGSHISGIVLVISLYNKRHSLLCCLVRRVCKIYHLRIFLRIPKLLIFMPQNCRYRMIVEIVIWTQNTLLLLNAMRVLSMIHLAHRCASIGYRHLLWLVSGNVRSIACGVDEVILLHFLCIAYYHLSCHQVIHQLRTERTFDDYTYTVIIQSYCQWC